MKMKRLLFLIILPCLMFSCNDDDGGYTQVKGIEHLIYTSIKEYREDNGLTGPFVHQFLMVEEAQLYSYKLAYEMIPYGLQGLDEHWNTIHEKIGGYNDQAVILSTNSSDENEILTQLLLVPGSDTIFLEDLTQCGVGVEGDGDGLNYITVLMMKVD